MAEKDDITILVKIEGGIVQEVITDSKCKIKVIVMDVDDEADYPVSIDNWTPEEANIPEIIKTTKEKFE